MALEWSGEWPMAIRIIKKGLVCAARKICQDFAGSYFYDQKSHFLRDRVGPEKD